MSHESPALAKLTRQYRRELTLTCCLPLYDDNQRPAAMLIHVSENVSPVVTFESEAQASTAEESTSASLPASRSNG